jgi:hypothetical protein
MAALLGLHKRTIRRIRDILVELRLQGRERAVGVGIGTGRSSRDPSSDWADAEPLLPSALASRSTASKITKPNNRNRMAAALP